MKVIKIELLFENCEWCELDYDMFKNLYISGIKKTRLVNCYQSKDGRTIEMKVCEEFGITINEKGLKQKLEQVRDITLKEKLKDKDITSIILHYDNNEHEEIKVKWHEDDEYTNRLQKNIEEENKIQVIIK